MSEAIKPIDKKLKDVDIFDPELMGCPHSFFKKLRDEAPVFQDPTTGIFQVSKHELICQVARDAKLFSNQFGAVQRSGGQEYPQEAADILINEGYPPVDTMLTADPPRHTRYRSLVDKAFAPKRVSELGPNIEEKINFIIDQFYDSGKCEVTTQISKQLPIRVIAEQLGVPLDDYDKFSNWSDAFVAQLSGTSSPEEHIEIAKKLVQFQQYFANKLDESEDNASDDILSDLANLTFEDDDGVNRKLEKSEQLSIIQQLLVAGNATTAHSISEAIYLLIANPDQMDLVLNDYKLIPNMVEESLRLLTPTNNMWRIATADTELDGVKIPKNSLIIIRYGSGNRDEDLFENPDKFDVTRKNSRRHVAFGQGIHVCIGMNLARKEMYTAFPIILDRLKNMRFGEDNDFVYSPNVLLRGLNKLNIEFDAN
ncbi:MAG: cytochrome P450 [Pseudomonadota bacterium]|nr:cytochrome P450 [Pseudomonadota bacterium]